FCRGFDVAERGNFEGASILNIKNGDQADGQAAARTRLFEAREKRLKPFRDEKVLTAWNGLMLTSFAEAAAVLENDEYLEVAKRNAEFLLQNLQKPELGGDLAFPNRQASANSRLLRTWKDGKAKLNGYLEDYANLADGLIELYQVSGEEKYLAEAKRLADAMITEFWDAENGGFFFTSNDHEQLIVRNKDFFDNATPSGNSVASDVMLRLAKLAGDERYERFSVAVLRLMAPQVNRYPQGFGRALSALGFHLATTKEIAVVGDGPNELEVNILRRYLPDAVTALSSDPSSDAAAIPWLESR